MKRFDHIDTWVFDLDNTIYNADEAIFIRMRQRMHEYISNLLNKPLKESGELSDFYYHTYGTTLAGLMKDHHIDPEDFLDYVHDLDISDVKRCDVVKERLSQLPGRKIIFTNAARLHAKRMIDYLGITSFFEDIYDISDAGYLPKPDPQSYDTFIKKFNINPQSACMLEDRAKNLKPAHDLGMTTIWFHLNNPEEQADQTGKHVHHQATDLKDWFTNYLES